MGIENAYMNGCMDRYIIIMIMKWKGRGREEVNKPKQIYILIGAGELRMLSIPIVGPVYQTWTGIRIFFKLEQRESMSVLSNFQNKTEQCDLILEQRRTVLKEMRKWSLT